MASDDQDPGDLPAGDDGGDGAGALRLPPREAEAEDLFVARFYDVGDPDRLTELVTEAMEARRPRLAARLVQLLPDFVEIPAGSALERAQRAAAMLVVDSRDVELFNALDEAWREVRRKRMRRMMKRQRLRGTTKQYSVPRVGRKPRRR